MDSNQNGINIAGKTVNDYSEVIDGILQSISITFTDGSRLTVQANSFGCCGCELSVDLEQDKP